MDDTRFDWDDANISHIALYGITSDEAEFALDNDPYDIGFEIRNEEERISQIGQTAAGSIRVNNFNATSREDESGHRVPGQSQSKEHIHRKPPKGSSMIKVDTPRFRDESEEAKWWFDHNDELTHHFEEAAANGTLGCGTAMRRIGLTSTKVLLPNKDADLARTQAAAKGLDFQAYLADLIHEGLQRAEHRP